ncbi:MAG TPA: GntR family transcriptional regulator [Terracidiphilus sp.]|nr:GntR family transcriptional regulator [Terracidiphilus sp.]
MIAEAGKSRLKRGGTMSDRVARHQIREEIQRRILSGETQPGERLSQQSLARELGVAQGTVRESLFELQWLGLVESIDRLGVFVGKLDVERICQAYQVRAVLEGLAARLSCNNAGRADIVTLRSMAEDIYKLAKKEKEDERGHLDRDFHFYIIKLSRNNILIRLAESYRVLGMTVRASREQQRILDEHLAIVDAIEKNNADDAERLARLHVTEAARRIEADAQQGIFVPRWVD